MRLPLLLVAGTATATLAFAARPAPAEPAAGATGAIPSNCASCHALTKPEGCLENVEVAPDGKVDFFDDSYTANGRGTF